jgi:hypothetical protein
LLSIETTPGGLVRERFVGGKAGESSCLLPSIFFLSPEKGANLVSHLNAGEWRACDSACSSQSYTDVYPCSQIGYLSNGRLRKLEKAIAQMRACSLQMSKPFLEIATASICMQQA